MDIRINTIYLIDAKDLGSKQCRCKIETMGKLPDDQRSGERKDVVRGTSELTRVRVTKNSDELVALDYLKSVHCIAI